MSNDQPRSTADQTAAAAEAEIEQLAHLWMDAVITRDAETLDRLLADDFRLASGRGEFVERDEWLRTALERLTATAYRYDDVWVRVYDDAAVMQSRWSQTATLDDQTWTGEGLLTDVWVKQGGQWRVVARHTNVPPPRA